MTAPVTVPPPNSSEFTSGICHPDLFLWDAWSFSTDTELHLYCLALNRKDPHGGAVNPGDRNNYPFHIRHFKSLNEGKSWNDEGCFQQPGLAEDGHDQRNIWSGSVLKMNDGRVLAAYTGIARGDNAHPFIQSIGFGFSLEGNSLDSVELLLCPKRDRKQLLDAGYYLAEEDEIGSKDGEDGGPILALRDPYLFFDAQAQLWMVWAAKQAPKIPAMGIARLRIDNSDSIVIESLLPPVLMPDVEAFSQLEVPKIYFDEESSQYLLFISTSTRESELQRESEVEKCLRMYSAKSLDAGWQSAGCKTSLIANLDNLFGMTVVDTDFEQRQLFCMAPNTEMAGAEDMLAFAPRFSIDVSMLGSIDQISAQFDLG